MSQVHAQSDPANFITIKEKAGVTTNQYPVQIGRPFVPGEIANFPQAVVNGTAVTTQADVKSRWSDGSVKHAILSFYLPTLAANSTTTVTFVNQTSGNNSSFLSKAQMLDTALNFDARMELTNGGTTVSASARSMLSGDKFEYWSQGGVMTSVIIADHSATRSADIGFDANKSFRPLFHATFWPGINKIKVRFIGEITNTEVLQDQIYALALKLGNTTQQTVYTKALVEQPVGSRWTKEFWLGGAPPVIEINHNLAYLTKTKFLPNYDTSRVIPEAALDEAYNNQYSGWTVVPKDLFDNGNILKYMGSTGGRDEIGPFTTWAIRWLYTGDSRAAEQAFGNAQLSAAFPVHFREGKTNKTFDDSGTNALGRVLSIKARPTIFLGPGNFFLDFSYTDAADKLTIVGNMTDGGWYPESAHQPDFHSPLYLLTGDYFYLEEMYFWAGWSAAYTSPGTDIFWGRGPTGGTGGISGEVRGEAWIFKNRVQAAFLAPDGTPEKAYFTKLTNDAIAIWEGTIGLTNTPNYGSANWVWGNTYGKLKFGSHGTPAIPTLRFWEEGGTVPGWSVDVDPAQATNNTANWQHGFLIYALGTAKNMGYSTETLFSWLAQLTIGQLTDPGFNPYAIASYHTPTVRLMDNAYYGLWPDDMTGFFNSYNAQADLTNQLGDSNHGYPFIAMAATAMIAGEPGGSGAWSFMQQNVATAPSINSNPKWAFLPTNLPPTCSYTLGNSSASIAASGGTGTVSVTAPGACSWNVNTSTTWITVSAPTSSVNGNGSVSYSVPANVGPARTGTVTIAGQTFTINQASGCTFPLSSSSASFTAAAGTGSVSVNASDTACAWAATSNAAWLTITAGANGGSPVNYSIAANDSLSSRTGSMTIAGQTFTVTQAAVVCTYGLSANSVTLPSSAAATNSVTVNPSNAVCPWTATRNVTWITITSGASGTGTGAVNFSVAENNSLTARTGTMTIAGLTFTVNQPAVVCTYSLSATSLSLTSSAAATNSVTVNSSNAICPRTAVSNASWITITSGASGTGNGTVNFSVAENNSLTARTGTMTIAGLTYTVNQPGIACSFSLSTTSINISSSATTRSVKVTASNAICPRTAESKVSWITVTSGASGTGNGTVTFSIAANPANTARTGTLTIAGITFTVNQRKN